MHTYHSIPSSLGNLAPIILLCTSDESANVRVASDSPDLHGIDSTASKYSVINKK
jgi:hypothetical protein